VTVVGSDGNTLWKGLASGRQRRFGRSYNLENYYEVLSDAVVNTVRLHVGNAQFQAACRGTSNVWLGARRGL